MFLDKTYLLRSLWLGLILIITQYPSKAQQSNSQDSTEFAFLPAISYNSDLGLIGGGVGSWYTFREKITPFYSYFTVSALVSTKGLASFSILHDKPQAFGKNMRLKTQVYASRFFEDTFFGIANYQKISGTPAGNPEFYQFNSFSAGIRTDLRLPLFSTQKRQQLDAIGIINLRYETPWDNEANRLISQQPPPGAEGGRTFMLGGGLIWEGRDSEFRPNHGNFILTNIEVGSTLWGSSYDLLIIEHDMRQYLTFHFIRDITLAGRLYLEHTRGDVPYWELAYAGDEETLRGFTSNRFMDDNVAYLNTELRTWLFEFPEQKVSLGGILFLDTGRTFSNETPISTMLDDLKYSAGFGALLSIFTPDFIIRADVGFSEEGTGVYFTTGFMF